MADKFKAPAAPAAFVIRRRLRARDGWGDAKPTPTCDFRIRMVDLDGNLLQNRQARREMYFKGENSRYDREIPDKKFIELSLKEDARTKGLEVVSYTISKDNIEALVRYL